MFSSASRAANFRQAMSTNIMMSGAPGVTPRAPTLPPNQTLYIKNLNPKINKQGLLLPVIPEEAELTFRSPTSIILSLWYIRYAPGKFMSLAISNDRPGTGCGVYESGGNERTGTCCV